MAVTSSKLYRSSQTFELNGSTPKRLTYRVQTDTKMSESSVYQQAQSSSPNAVPSLGQWLGDQAYVTRVQVEPTKEFNYRTWDVTVTGERVTLELGGIGSADQGAITGDPLLAPLDREPVIWPSTYTETRIIREDKDGNPIVNSADQEFDEPITEDIELTVINVRKYYDDLELLMTINQDFWRTENAAVFVGNPIGTVKYLSTKANEPIIEAGALYYLATTQFLVDPDGHDVTLFDRGWHYYDRPKTSIDAKLINGVSDSGVNDPILQPVYLSPDGTRKPKGDPINKITFDLYASTSYADFLLPESQVTR